MIIVWIALSLLFVFDALKTRRRLRALGRLESSDEAISKDHRFFLAGGVEIDDETRRAASAYCRKDALGVLDLVPGNLPVLDLFGLVQLFDPRLYRRDRLSTGRTAGHALVVTTETLNRAQVDLLDEVLEPIAFIRLAKRLKRYASDSSDLAIAPLLHARRIRLSERRALLREWLGTATGVAVFVQALVIAILISAAVVDAPWGALPLVAFHAQVLIACVGLRPLVVALLRAPLELVRLGAVVVGPRPSVGNAVEEARPVYEKLLADGLDRFFEARQRACPVCDGEDLAVHHRVSDLVQGKPGRFTLEECNGCGHIFQNPRLSLAGLAFYYKDSYDGLGEEGVETLFAYSAEPYLARVRLLALELSDQGNKRWLDVGCGHGHFCAVAKDALPLVAFDGLDLSESVDDARRRGWIDHAYHGLFPELSNAMANQYDAVSMHHYLEHTIDPRAELRAAHQALTKDGLLLIELPDPESALRKLLGPFWLPWFQPQHLHFLSVKNLERLLREQGFEPLRWERGPAHVRIDMLAGMTLLLSRFAPRVDVPWLPRATALARVMNKVIWISGIPALLIARVLDQLLVPLTRRQGISNAYRVVARKSAPQASLRSPSQEIRPGRYDEVPSSR